MDLKPSYFFDLSAFKYKELFDGCQYVWEALSKISPLLKSETLGQIEAEVPKEAFLINPDLISIGQGTVIEPGAYIKGPCIIGENCAIRHGAYIRGDIVVGNGCVIGHDTEIKNSIMLNDAHAAHFAYVGDTIIGSKANLGAGTKCANLKFDNSQVIIHNDGSRILTGFRKLGAIIGDGAQIGCNAVTNPGTLIGKNAIIYPCTNIGGCIASNNIVQPEIKISIKRP